MSAKIKLNSSMSSRLNITLKMDKFTDDDICIEVNNNPETCIYVTINELKAAIDSFHLIQSAFKNCKNTEEK